MKLSDFDYLLPKDLIAAYPPEDRPSAKLLCVERMAGRCSHHVFRDIHSFLRPGDVLVLNNTKVIPARIFGRKETGGQVEALLLKNRQGSTWEALIRPNGRIKKNARLCFGNNGTTLEAHVLDDPRSDSGRRLLEFKENSLQEKLQKLGHMPLPPYLNRPDIPLDRELYQTVFAEREGAVASPTAGLHFNQPLLTQLKEKGVEIVFVTLHVGYGTFKPITEEDLTRHPMEEEEFEMTVEAAEKINAAIRENRRIIACGTTSVRVLESSVSREGEVEAQEGKTRLFIYPPYPFKVVDGLITNFHLPKSTLLLLVAAFFDAQGGQGREKLFKVYEEAIRQRYHFYSYGDAMLIL